MSSFFSSILGDLHDAGSAIYDALPSAADVGRGTLALGTLGISEYQRAEQQRQLAALNQALSNPNPQQQISQLSQVSPEFMQERLKALIPQPNKVEKDAFGNPILINPQTGATTPVQGLSNPLGMQSPQATSGGQQAPSTAALTGDDFLKTLPPSAALQVKSLAEGKMPFPGGFALKSPYWQQMIQAVGQYDPTFDAVNYNARAGTRKDFTSGKTAQNITALNTAMSHLDSLNNAYNELGNSDYPSYNKIANYLGNATGNQKIQGDTARVSTDAEAVSHELAKVFRSTGMSEGEIKAWKEKIDTNTTPAQQKAVIGGAIDLMNGRIQALGQQYNKGMGTTKDGLELLSPEAQQAYQRLSGGEKGSSATKQGGISDGVTATNPKTGQKIIFKGGQWRPL